MPRYTEFPQTGEDYSVSAARVSTWILAQMTPEQFKALMKETTGKTLPDNARIELSPNWAARAVIPLIDNSWGILVGIRLVHSNFLAGKESFVWQSEGTTFTIEMSYGEDKLILELLNPPRSFLRRTSSLDIFITNIYQEAEEGISCQFSLIESKMCSIPIPVLVEDIPSVLLWITKDMKRFVRGTYPPIRYSLRETAEEILKQKGF